MYYEDSNEDSNEEWREIKVAREKYHVYRLVALTFFLKEEGKEYVNHIDGDFNKASNLEWQIFNDGSSREFPSIAEAQRVEKLYFKWCSEFDLARHRLLAIDRQEGSQEVKRIGIIIDKETSLEIYEIPTKPHAKIISIMDNWSNQLLVLGENDMKVNIRNVYRCDACVEPLNRQLPQTVNSYPTLVVEIGNTEGLNHLKGCGIFTLHTTIQLYLTIKLYPRRQNNLVASLALMQIQSYL
ncbi:hypothetical protein Glove_166g234 [Diversispora epigaea]|uniref:HNH nuclease domain-containing protein n=1 Tax=Diversispora epigaea TaxID=1348612 RepID=A0A397IZ10_9GLOM|nr:hypothetical protein Glove_166g234 [Diversispora epigaea]